VLLLVDGKKVKNPSYTHGGGHGDNWWINRICNICKSTKKSVDINKIKNQ